MVELTEQQGKALELDKHFSVTANAGSGKTRVLVERFVAAVKGGTKVEKILCLTFTEKAALELREKIGARINLEFQEARNGSPEYRSALKDARDRLLEANISTIHSFCSQLLREFPVEAGIDANFKVLEDFDASSLKKDASSEAVMYALEEERTNRSSGKNGGKVRKLLVRVGYGNVLKLLEEMLNNREKIEHARLRGSKLIVDEKTIRSHWINLVRAVVEVIKLNVVGKKGDFDKEAEVLTELISGDSVGLPGVIAQLQTTLDGILTKKGTPRKREVVIESGGSYSSDEALSILQAAFGVTRLADEESTLSGGGKYVDVLGAILNLLDKSEERYAHKKFLMGALDFDDLQILAQRLLRDNGSVRDTLTSRFKQIMVDEFQDTNFLQYEIFISLLDNFGSDAKLFVVGDPKQSIYRFRNAQVEVSKVAGDRIFTLADGTCLSLSESFRMNSDIAGFVNEIFPQVLRGGKVFGAIGLPSLEQTDYNPLVPRRPTGATNPVELFVQEKGGQDESAQDEGNGYATGEVLNGDPQARFVAARIVQMVTSGEKIRSAREGEKERPIRYGDIAILMRTRTRLPKMETALTEFRVPFVVSSGIGFYSAQEIFDLTNYLKFLLDNNADIPLLSVLRSPFFGVSDNELYEISLLPGNTLFERLVGFARSGDAADEVVYAATLLNEETQLAHRMTIPELINRILERTGWIGAYRLSPTGDQRIANLRKLLEIAREFEGRGFNSLYDFVERINYLKESAQEGQAPVEEAVDAVKIMTVHAAKGLEFPIVVVPFCDASSHHSIDMVINDYVGILPFVDKRVPPEFSIYKYLEEMSGQAEISRLFYVACTRAMDKLILTTTPKRESNPVRSFADILSRRIDFAEAALVDFVPLGDAEVRVHHEVPSVEGRVEARSENGFQLGKFYLDQLPAGIDGEIYSATVMQTYKLCPTKYFLRYRIGMPTTGLVWKFNENAEHNDAILSTVKGQIVHAVLEKMIVNDISEKQNISAFVKESISSVVDGGLTEKEHSDLASFVTANARNAMATFVSVAQQGKRLAERTITRRFRSDFLTGTLDLLIEDGAGFHIYDYKTNRLDRPEEDIYAGYEIQMKLYASLCAALKAEQNEFDVTIIFTREPGKYLRRVYTREDLREFEEKLAGMIQEMKGIGSEESGFPAEGELPTTSPHCPECEYFVGEGRRECLLKR